MMIIETTPHFCGITAWANPVYLSLQCPGSKALLRSIADFMQTPYINNSEVQSSYKV